MHRMVSDFIIAYGIVFAYSIVFAYGINCVLHVMAYKGLATRNRLQCMAQSSLLSYKDKLD